MAAKILLAVVTLFVGVSAVPSNETSSDRLQAAIADVEGRSTVRFLDSRSSPRSLLANASQTSSSDAKDLSTAEAMEAAITDLMLGKSAFGATPMGGSVKTIKNLLTKTMMPKVIAAHRSDQRMMNKLVGEIRKCGTAKSSAFRGAKSQFLKYKKSSKLHKGCRTDEAIRYTSKKSCISDQKSKYRLKDLKCKAYAAASTRYGTTKSNRDIVGKGGSESVESYVQRLSTTFCGKHVHGKKGTVSKPGGWGGGLEGGFLDKYLKAKEECRKATQEYVKKVKECKRKSHAYNVRKAQCNQYQGLMDGSSCKRAVLVKDACESYEGCYHAAVKSYRVAERKTRFNERDRTAEWRGLKRMSCLVNSFADGKVTRTEVDACKRQAHSTKHLGIKYPKVPPLAKCTMPTLYPATGAYKRAEFAPLPLLAKGKISTECSGVTEIATKAARGSPKSCKCRRLALNGYFSPGPVVKCTNCIDTRRSKDRNSCPVGTKIFSPSTRADWKTFIASAAPLRHPHWIIDVTRPQNGCGGCTSNPMNSGNSRQKSWRTLDSSPWWLRSTRYSEPNGDYNANCFLDLWRRPSNENSVTFNDGRCNYHSKSYYCQPIKLGLSPRSGSPKSCKCAKVDLTGSYSAGVLVKCEQCITVHRSSQKNSCPAGMKIFSPRSRSDWKTFLSSAGPLRAPHWIIDVTRPQNGCGGCTRYPMKSTTPQQATWRTSDRSPWWLRNSRYSEPNGDYNANCFLDLWRRPSSENTVTFNDGRCNYRSRSYYCQPDKAASTPPKPAARAAPKTRRLVSWSQLKSGVEEKAFYFRQGSRCPSLRGRQPHLSRKVKIINYPNTGGPFSGLSRRDNFAISWTGYVIVKRAGTYSFYLTSDDGSKLSINRRTLVNNDGLHGARTRGGRAKLVAGQHYFDAIMFERGGHAAMLVKYRGPDTGNRRVFVNSNGRSLMYKPTKGFREQAFYESDLERMLVGGLRRIPNMNRKAAATRVVPAVNYRNTGGTWPGFSSRDNFAVRWTGFLTIGRTGRYRFSLYSDDGSRLYLGRSLVVNNDGLHGWRNREANYNMGRKHAVKVEFFERGGHAGILFRYMGYDTRNRMVPVPSSRMVAAY